MNRYARTILLILLTAALLTACSPKSAAPALPTATPTPIPGWAKFSAPGVELWLPDTYQGGDLANDLDVITAQLKQRGAEYDTVVKMIEENRSAFTIWAFDTQTGPSGALTNVNVVKEQVLSAVTVEKYADAVQSQLPSDFTVSDRSEVKIGDLSAMRLTIEMSDPSIKEVMYLVKGGNTMWAVTYATSTDEFEQRLPTFEQSINTLRFTP